MAMFGMMFMLPMLMLGGGDLLDLVDTQTYWQMQQAQVSVESMSSYFVVPKQNVDIDALIKQLGNEEFRKREEATQQLAAIGKKARPQLTKGLESADPEVKARCQDLLNQLSESQNDMRVTRLMAIRTLGELKDAKALPLLETLTKSQDVFEADYARMAIERIKTGKVTYAKADPALLKKHLWMLPKDCGYVAQVDTTRLATDQKLDIFKAMAQIPQVQGQIEEMKQSITKELVKGVSMFGNVRLNGLTVGVSQDMGDNAGFVVLIGHGLYSKAAVESQFKELCSEDQCRESGIPGVNIYCPDNEVAMIPVSNELFVMIAGPKEQLMPVDQVITALKNGRGTLDQNEAMKELIGRADTTKPLWAAARLTDKMWAQMPVKRDMIPLGAMEDVTLAIHMDEKGDTHITAVGRGKDAANVQASAAMMQAFSQMGANVMRQEVMPQLPSAKNIVEFLEKIEYKAEDKTLTAKGLYQGNIAGEMMSLPMMMFMMIGVGF